MAAYLTPGVKSLQLRLDTPVDTTNGVSSIRDDLIAIKVWYSTISNFNVETQGTLAFDGLSLSINIPNLTDGTLYYVKYAFISAIDPSVYTVSSQLSATVLISINARAVGLTTVTQAFTYTSAGITPSPATSVVTATGYNTTGTVYYEFLLNNTQVQNTTSNTYTYTSAVAFSSMPQIIKVNLREGTNTSAILATDIMSMIGVKPGIDGSPGSPGVSPISGFLTNETSAVTTASDGSGGSYSNSGGTFKVYNGITDVTGTATYSVVSSAGVTISIATTGIYTVTGTSTDQGTATLRAVYGGVTIDKIYDISRAKAGIAGTPGTNGTPGTTGTRGSRTLYSSSSGYTSTYTIAPNAAGAVSYAVAATTLIAAATSGSIPTTPIQGDTVTFSNPTSGSEYVYTITHNGTAWVTPGTVIDGSLLVTGTVTAAKINSNGLSIKDANGNIILSAGVPLDFTNVGGTTKPAANANNTFVDANGAIQGTSSGAGTVVKNSNISLSSAGVLTGAAAGSAVTIGGLGYSGSLSANNTSIDASGNIQGVSSGAGTVVNNNYIENSILHVYRPLGASAALEGTATGAIKIRLPQGFTNTMLKFYVEIYEYNTNGPSSYNIGGYNYAGNNTWYNAFATYTGAPNNVRPVYFGYDTAGYCCIWIGAPANTWSYPKIRIIDFTAGYSNFTEAQWATGWLITFDTVAATNVTTTVQAPTPGGALSGSDSITSSNVSSLVNTNAGLTNSQIGVSINSAGVISATGGPSASGFVSISGLGYSGSLSATNTSIDANGAIQGTSSGAGTVVRNSSIGITVGTTGALTIAGGPTSTGFVTIGGLGYTGSLSATNTSIDANGAIQGTSSGAGTVVRNSSIGITVGTTGALTIAGGPTSTGFVTIGGLGYTGSLSANNTFVDASGAIQGVSSGGGTAVSNSLVETLSLSTSGGMTVAGNSFTKTSGGGGWDAQVYSNDSYVGGAYVRFSALQTWASLMVGLNTDPTANASYETLDYAIYLAGNVVYIYESGTGYNMGMNYTLTDVFSVTYDGSNIKYYKNGTVLRTVAVTITSPLYLDSSFANISSGVSKVSFGPLTSNAWASIGGANKPQDNANNTSIDANGAIQGTSSGAGTVVKNSNISLSSAGVLSGAAAGSSVTIGGLGYTGALNATFGADWSSNVTGAAGVNTSISSAATAASNAQGTANSATTAASNAQGTANSAATAASNAQAAANAAATAAADRISKSTATTLSATVSVNAITGAGFRAGSLIWDSAGARTGGSGVAMTPGGLVGYSAAGVNTFSISASTGAASFAGTLSVGTTPAIVGTTMTGAGALINTAGTFALGNSTTNISYNGTQMTLNGNVVATGNLNPQSASKALNSTSAGNTITLTFTVEADATAIFIDYYIGSGTVRTVSAGSGKTATTSTDYYPAIGTLQASINSGSYSNIAGMILAPTAGTWSITLTRQYYDTTTSMRLSILVLKR